MTTARRALRPPMGLGPSGRDLWRGVVADHELDVVQQVHLLEACRVKDRLDKLADLITGRAETWGEVDLPGGGRLTLELNATEKLANSTATTLKQLLAALRLPDSRGVRPQRRGSARGAYVPGGRPVERPTARRLRERTRPREPAVVDFLDPSDT